MQAIGIILVLISIGTIVGPVGAVAVIYRADLSQLVITPQIRDIMNGNSSIIPINSNSDNGDSNGNGDQGFGGLMTPVFVSAQSDMATNTFTGIFEVTNTLNYDLTLNNFSTDVVLTQPNIQAGSIGLASPVTVAAGATSQLTISGHWTPQAQEYITNSGSSSIDISVVNIVIDVNGITIQTAGPIEVGSIPLTVEG